MVRYLEAAKLDWRLWKQQACFQKETNRLREAVECKLCRKTCSKAVSLTCCPSVSCRNCALSKLKEDNQRCWTCGQKAVNLVTPSQLVNHNLVRAGVKHLMKEAKVTKNSPFVIFLLLHSCQQTSGENRNLDAELAQPKVDYLKTATFDETNKVKAEKAPSRPKITQPLANRIFVSHSPSEFHTIRVPHTYNGILTVIATVRVPVSPSQ